MEMAKCFRALGFSEMPKKTEAVKEVYEQRRKLCGNTESGKLAARLLEENYRRCLDWFAANANPTAGEREE